MSDEERKRLVWNIKKKVYTLNTGELFQLTKDIHSAPDADVTPLKDGDEESYINYIVTYMHSCELYRLSDQGITVLMNLNECIDEIVEKRVRTEKVTQPSIAFHNTDTSEEEYQRILSNYEELGRKRLASRTKPTTLAASTIMSHTHIFQTIIILYIPAFQGRNLVTTAHLTLTPWSPSETLQCCSVENSRSMGDKEETVCLT